MIRMERYRSFVKNAITAKGKSSRRFGEDLPSIMRVRRKQAYVQTQFASKQKNNKSGLFGEDLPPMMEKETNARICQKRHQNKMRWTKIWDSTFSFMWTTRNRASAKIYSKQTRQNPGVLVRTSRQWWVWCTTAHSSKAYTKPKVSSPGVSVRISFSRN